MSRLVHAVVKTERSSQLGSVTFKKSERLLWRLLGRSTGAPTRMRVLNAIRATPSNAQQISDKLRLDYTTVRHHLRILEQSGLIVAEGNGYGRVYFISDSLEARWADLQGILEKATSRGDG